MKKIFLLFVLCLGLNVGVSSASDFLAPEGHYIENPEDIFIVFQDGTVVIIDDGKYCNDVYLETDGGGTYYAATSCP